MDDVVKGFLFGLLVSCFVLGLGFVSAEEIPEVSWFNDSLYNDSCVVLKSDQYSYMRLDNQPVFGQLKVINSCGKELKDVKVIFYGASGGKISLVKLDKVDGVKEVPVEVKKTDTTVTTHRVLADAVNANKLELKVETPVNVEGVIDLASVAIMTKVVDKEILDREIKSLDLVSSEEGTLTIGTGVTYYNFTIQPEQNEGEFAIELKGLSVLDPTYYSYDGNIITGGVYNGGFEYGTGSATTTSFIGAGDNNYKIYFSKGGSATATASFDTTTKHSGNQSLKLSVLASVGTSSSLLIGSNVGTGATLAVNNLGNYGINIKPLTEYKYCVWFKTEDYNGSLTTKPIALHIYNSAGTRLSNNSPTEQYSGATADWHRVCLTKISDATAKYAVLAFSIISPDGNGTVWVDDVRLEEVHNYNLSSQAVGVPSITITGVTDTNAIDQADTNNSSNGTFGRTTANNKYICQQFLPTQNKLTGITIQKDGGTGTYAGDVNFTIRDGNAILPTSKILAQNIIANATWNALTNSTDYFVALPAILDANGTNKYWICLNSSTSSDTDYARIRADINPITSGYTNGLRVNSQDFVSWSADSNDLYFKTHFAKLSSSTDMNVVNADGSSTNFVLNMPEILTDANITIRPDGTGRYYTRKITGFPNIWSDILSIDRKIMPNNLESWSNSLILSNDGDSNAIIAYYMPKGCKISNDAKYSLYGNFTATRYFLSYYSFDKTNWTKSIDADGTTYTDQTLVTIPANDKNVVYIKFDYNSGQNTYIKYVNFDANFTCTGLTYPRFEYGDNNTLIMQTNDFNWANTGDVINKTPSMTQKMYYTFDKPTTNITTTSHPTLNNTRLITLTCETNQDWQTCNKTYYSTNGTTYTEYTNPITIQTETPIYYYSTTTNGDTETTNTTTITITPQLSTGTCGLTQLLFLAIAGLILIAILFILVQNFSIETLIAFIPIIIIIIISMMLSQSIVSIVCIA